LLQQLSDPSQRLLKSKILMHREEHASLLGRCNNLPAVGQCWCEWLLNDGWNAVSDGSQREFLVGLDARHDIDKTGTLRGQEVA
jgi:hypothetical protein